MTAEPQSAAHLNQETLFRKAMSSFPTGVTIVTTRDAHGRRRGFTATAFCHVSTQPRLVLVCLSANAECHPAFVAADRWNVHVIPAEHAGLARRFATRGADKFADAEFEIDSHGIPRLDRACITLSCSMHQVYPGRYTDVQRNYRDRSRAESAEFMDNIDYPSEPIKYTVVQQFSIL